jgi:hypothetical protein
LFAFHQEACSVPSRKIDLGAFARSRTSTFGLEVDLDQLTIIGFGMVHCRLLGEMRTMHHSLQVYAEKQLPDWHEDLLASKPGRLENCPCLCYSIACSKLDH